MSPARLYSAVTTDGVHRCALPARSLAVATGLVIDSRWGEPPAAIHPVALFGRLMSVVERRLYRDDRAAGAVFAAIGLGLGAGTGRLVERRAGAGGVVVASATASASRMLAESALAVGYALDRHDLEVARDLVRALVGRDPSGLDEAELARAVVESVAENCVDAVVAPAFWAAVAGGAGVLAHRAVNTLDAMVGHRSARYQRFGWASARLDDAAAWVPARLTALVVATVRPRAAPAIWQAVRRQAPGHPSPNSGVAEAAFAAALGRQLGGVSRYGERVEHRPLLGAGPAVGVADIERATALLRDVTRALVAALVVVGVLSRVVGGGRLPLSRTSRVGRPLRRSGWLLRGSRRIGSFPGRVGTR